MRPIVSVVVPVFNTRRYLEACLRSIAAQTLAEIEIICVDDGSTDGSHEVVAALQATDPRIRLLRHERNRGIGAARNTGVRAAQADYITAVDSDDTIEADMLAAMHAAAIEGDFDIVTCGMREVNEQGETLRTIIPQDRTIIIEGAHRDVFAITNPSAATKLWKRTLHTDNDLYFDETTLYEDLGWTYRALLRSRRIRILGAAYYNYLLRPGSVTHSLGWRNLTDHIATFELLRRALVEEGVARDHAEPFRNLVRQTLKYHAGKALEAGGTNEDTLRYLRCILAIRRAYTLPDEAAEALPDAAAIIHAIEFDAVDARDTRLREQQARIDRSEATMREAASLLRMPLALAGPLSRLCIALGHLSGQAGPMRYGLRLRRLRRRLTRQG